MSLTNLFNMNYFIQNLKKSKGLIIFAVLLLPVFLTLTLKAFDEEGNILNFAQLSAVNTIFMYIIPIVLSISLFDFVYKKKSADFICSMPLSRKTIFTTNTIGGIVLLVLLQLVTMIITFVFSKVSTQAIIFGSMIWDVFLVYTVSYIFVFIVCNLAITFSGNLFSTIVSVLLILFFIPFSLVISKTHSYTDTNYYGNIHMDENDTLTYFEPLNLTTPSLLFGEITEGNVSYEFNLVSIIKMIVLSIIYFVLGLFIFNRKRFEMAEESYENDFMHLTMKLLSLAPFAAFLVETKLYNETIGFLFFIAIVAVYYYVFDLITNKKIKLRVTLASFAISLLAMSAFFAIIVPRLGFITSRKVELSDIKSVKIDTILVDGYDNEFGLMVEDKDLIEKLLKDSENYNFSSFSNYHYSSNTDLLVTTNNNKTFKISKTIGNVILEVLEKYGNQKFELSDFNMIPHIDNAKVSNEEQKEMLDLLKEDLKDLSYEDYFEKLNNAKEFYLLTLSQYKNHRLLENNFSGAFDNVSKKCIEIVNERAIKNANKISSWSLIKGNDMAKFIKKINPTISGDTDYYADGPIYSYPYYDKYISSNMPYEVDGIPYEETLDGIMQYAFENIPDKTISEFVKSHREEKFDKNLPYLILKGWNPRTTFYTNDVKGLYILMAKAYNEAYDGENKVRLSIDV